MTTSERTWVDVSKAEPCEICDQPKWCSRTDDGELVICRRMPGKNARQKIDKIGQVYWIHGAGESSGPLAPVDRRDIHAEVEEIKNLWHRVYTRFLEQTNLYEDDAQKCVEERGLTHAELQRLGYRSIPTDFDTAAALKKLTDEFGTAALKKVPGFARDGQVKLCAFGAGYFVPWRDHLGRIAGLQVRTYEAGRKYLPYQGDVKPVLKHHVPLELLDVPLGDNLRIVEGAIKADIATLRTEVLTIGIPSGQQWLSGIELVQPAVSQGHRVILAPDADTKERPGICTALALACVALAEQGANFALEVWDPKLGKGIDDVFAAKHGDKIQTVEGAEVWTTLQPWLVASGAPPVPGVDTRTITSALIERAKQDPEAVYRPGVSQAIARLGEDTVESQRLLSALRAELKTAKFNAFSKSLTKAKKEIRKEAFEAEVEQQRSNGEKVFERGDDTEIAHTLLEDVTGEEGVADDHGQKRWTQAVYDEGSIYLASDNIYAEQVDAQLRARITAYAGTRLLTKQQVMKINKGQMTGGLGAAQDIVAKEGFFAAAPRGIAFRNGFLRVDEIKQTMDFVPLTLDHRARYAHDFEYRPGLTPEKLLEATKVWWGHADDYADRVAALQEFIGAAFAGLGARYARALICPGPGGRGKSTLSEIIEGLFPERLRSSTEPQQLEHEYHRAKLAGKLLNIVNDVSDQAMLDASAFKRMSVGDTTGGRHPTGRPFDFKPMAAHVFTLEELFPMRDFTDGFERRWLMLTFDGEKLSADTAVKKVEGLAKVILAEERESIVSWSIEGLKRRLAQTDYTLPRSSVDGVREWMGENNSVWQFMQAECFVDGTQIKEEHWTQATTLRSAYADWCKENGLRDVGPVKFGKRLKHLLKMGKDEGMRRGRKQFYPVEMQHVRDAREDGERVSHALGNVLPFRPPCQHGALKSVSGGLQCGDCGEIRPIDRTDDEWNEDDDVSF